MALRKNSWRLVVALPLLALAVPAHAALRAEGLRCEYLTNPIGLDETAPRLSWQLRSGDRGVKQSAYQILCARSTGDLSAGHADLWDSGKISSAQSAQVAYHGKPVPPGTRCYWKVRVWDANGKESGFSRAAFWEMGLPGSRWTARWIGLPQPPAEIPVVSLEGAHWVWYPEGNPVRSAPAGARYFRREVEVDGSRKLVRARMVVAVDNSAIVYVNGKEAGQAAGWQDAPSLDLTSHLKPGTNLIAIAATNESEGPAGLMARLQLDYDRGASAVMDVDRTWLTSQTGPQGWNQSGFDAAAWKPSQVIAAAGAQPWGKPGLANSSTPPPSPYLRREFTVEKPVKEARAYVTALGAYQLYLNGKQASKDILAPGWTDYHKRVQYQTYDVTPLLKKGTNAVGAILGDGWYAGSLGWGLSRNNFGPGPSRLRVELHVRYADGSEDVVRSDENWRGATGPIQESDIYGGEVYDARKDLSGWSEPGVGNGSPWRSVTAYTDQNPELNAQQDYPIRVTQELPTKTVAQPKPGVYVFDLGQNMVGMARLKVHGPAGTQVVMRFAEVLNPDGTVYRENLRRARATDTYILNGNGEEVFEPHFTYHGFRYVEVTGFPGVPTKAAITGLVFHSSMPFTSRLETSNPLVNRLYRNITWGQRANLMSVPTDCPQRDERLGWMGDANIFARSSCWNMDMAAFYTKWMRDIVDAQSPEGAFSDVSPRVIDMADGAPAWSDAGIVIPWTVYECYGDTRIIERNYAAMKKYVDMLHRANPDLLWLKRRNNDFGDWVAAGEGTNKDLIASAYFAYDLRLLSRMADAIGRTADAQQYGRLADESKRAFNARFLQPDGKYLGDSQTTYAMILGMDLAPEDRRAAIGRRLAETVRRRGSVLSTGFIGTKFLLPALTATGHNDLAYTLLENTKYPSWGYMIGKGATTIWELWNSDTQGPGMNSRNHFAFGSVAEWMQRDLGGIEVDSSAPGYRYIHIRPQPGGDLTSARTEYESLYGTIVSDWKLEDGAVVVRVTIPANTEATVDLPKRGSGPAVVTENGERAWASGQRVNQKQTPGIQSGSETADAVTLRVGSGSYVFRISAL